MSQIPSPQPVPVQSSPAQQSPPPSAPAAPFVPDPSDSAILWLVTGMAALFVGYLSVDAVIQRVRTRRLERLAKQPAVPIVGDTDQMQETDRRLTPQRVVELPPRR